MLGNLFQDSKNPPRNSRTCVQCNNRLKSNSITLNDGTFIDQQCLQFVQLTINQGNADEDMLLYYQYIFSLVPVCQKCSNIIDGQTRKRANEGVNPPACTLCQPVKKQQTKEPQFCALCEKQLSEKLYKDLPFVIEGMKICQKCYSYQLKGLEETKEKEEKPDFGSLAFRGKQKISIQQEKKQKQKPQSQYEFKPDFKCKLSTQIKKQIPKYPYLKEPRIKFQQEVNPPDCFFNMAADLFNYEINKKMHCKTCRAEYSSKKKDDTKGLCPFCFKDKNQKIEQRQGQKNKQESFGLDALFNDEKSAQESLPDDHLQLIELPPLPPLPPLVPVIPTVKSEPKIQIDLDCHNYDLKGCKICFNAKSTMINNKCRHLMICEQCCKQLMTRRKVTNGMMPCPYCTTLGKYTTYIEPIYI